MFVIKKNGEKEKMDFSKVRKQTVAIADGLDGVSFEEIEIEAKLRLVDGISTKDISNSITKACSNLIDIDRKNYEYAAARSVLLNLYHSVGKVIGTEKGKPYAHSFSDYVKYGLNNKKLNKSFSKMSEKEKQIFNNAIDPERDKKFKYIGVISVRDRYLLKNSDGEYFELPQHLIMAVAFMIHHKEKKSIRSKLVLEYYNKVSNQGFLPSTPGWSNIRKPKSQGISCFIGSTPNSIEGIFYDTYLNQALLSKYGGGLGWDWSNITAEGGSIDGNKGVAGGPVPFLHVENGVMLAVDQLGTRKGSSTNYLPDWHNGIFDFIDLIKKNGEVRRRAHDITLSIIFSDLFMKRKENNEDWNLFDPKQTPLLNETYGSEFEALYEKYEKDDSVDKVVVKAKDLWRAAIVSYNENGMPFHYYKDNVNRKHMCNNLGIIRSLNLCTEIAQVSGIAMGKHNYYCDLRSNQPGGLLFKPKKNGEIKMKDYDKLNKIAVCALSSVHMGNTGIDEIKNIVPTIVRALDNTLEINYYPVAEAKATALLTRGIGVGVMGENEWIVNQGFKYGSDGHIELVKEYYETLMFYTIKASADLAIEKGVPSGYKGSKWEQGIFPWELSKYGEDIVKNSKLGLDWEGLRMQIKETGIRNLYLLAIAPTSTISLVGGTTQSIEPIFKRKWFENNLLGNIPVLAPNLNIENINLYDNASNISKERIIYLNKIRQCFIDQTISFNIFIDSEKENITGKVLSDWFTSIWEDGIGSTYYLRALSATLGEDNVVDRSIECSGCQ